jgi:hypothetical protein
MGRALWGLMLEIWKKSLKKASQKLRKEPVNLDAKFSHPPSFFLCPSKLQNFLSQLDRAKSCLDNCIHDNSSNPTPL